MRVETGVPLITPSLQPLYLLVDGIVVYIYNPRNRIGGLAAVFKLYLVDKRRVLARRDDEVVRDGELGAQQQHLATYLCYLSFIVHVIRYPLYE